MEKLKKLLEELAPKVKVYEARQKERMETGFNLFYLISDYYYRETFHSDIIAAILNPNEKHENGNGYIDLFIDMINKDIKVPINKDYYTNSKVSKEYGTNDGMLGGRIDIFIEGCELTGKKHCIVIENKLNNAGDTKEQLPKYYRDLDGKGFEIDAFVYLPLDPNKRPDKSGWGDEKKKIDEKLVIVPAYIPRKTNLIDNWLTPSEKEGNDDAKFVIRQYIKVLKNLTINIMDNKTIVETLTLNDNIGTTLCILEQRDSICNVIKSLFVKKIADEIQKNKVFSVDYQDLAHIKITNSDYPSWLFIIEYVGGNTNRHCRYLKYNKEIIIPVNKKIWEKENPKYPFGWDYYNGDRGYWDNIKTLKEMIGNEFANDVISECIDSFKEIDIQNLPK